MLLVEVKGRQRRDVHVNPDFIVSAYEEGGVPHVDFDDRHMQVDRATFDRVVTLLDRGRLDGLPKV